MGSIALLPVLLSAVVMDFREGRISNRLIAFGLLLGLIFRMLGEGGIGIVRFLVNISIPVILLFLLFQLRVLGAGDIKLFSVVGGFLDMRQLCMVVAAAFLAGAVIGILKLLYQRKTIRAMREHKTLIHFSLAIFIGYIVTVWGCLLG